VASGHDLGLYEGALSLALYALLVCVDRRGVRPGRLLATAALVFAGGRFALELLRDDPRLGGLTAVQYGMVAMAGAGAWWFVKAAPQRPETCIERTYP
jgi:prolipoprotein diacylglyceryltransferase